MDSTQSVWDIFTRITSMWSIEDGVFVALGLAVYALVFFWGTNRQEGTKTDWKRVFGLLLQGLLWIYLQTSVIHHKMVDDLFIAYPALGVSCLLSAAAIYRYTKDDRWMMVMSGLLGGVVAFGALLSITFGKVPVGLAMVMGMWLGVIGGLTGRTIRFAGMSAKPDESGTGQEESVKAGPAKGKYKI